MRRRCQNQLEGVKRELRDVSNSERGFVEDPLVFIAYNAHCKQGENKINPFSSFSTQSDKLINIIKLIQYNNKL